MRKNPLDKIISIVREEMMTANPPGGQGGYTSNTPKPGETDGYDVPLGGKKPRKRVVGLWSSSLRGRSGIKTSAS